MDRVIQKRSFNYGKKLSAYKKERIFANEKVYEKKQQRRTDALDCTDHHSNMQNHHQGGGDSIGCP